MSKTHLEQLFEEKNLLIRIKCFLKTHTIRPKRIIQISNRLKMSIALARAQGL